MTLVGDPSDHSDAATQRGEDEGQGPTSGPCALSEPRGSEDSLEGSDAGISAALPVAGARDLGDRSALRQIELLEQVLSLLDHLVVVYPDVALAGKDVDVGL